MIKNNSVRIGFQTWIGTAFLFALIMEFLLYQEKLIYEPQGYTVAFVFTFIASFPVFPGIWILFGILQPLKISPKQKIYYYYGVVFFVGLVYAAIIFLISQGTGRMSYNDVPVFSLALIACIVLVNYLLYNKIASNLHYHTSTQTINNLKIKTMESNQVPDSTTKPASQNLLVKGIITGVLILAMMIPTVFIMNLVKERSDRQKEVVAEVSSKWAGEQTLSGPFLVVPYREQVKAVNNYDQYSDNDEDASDAAATVAPAAPPVNANATKYVSNQLIIIPDQLNVNSSLFPEERKRSIYKVILYRSETGMQGKFMTDMPEGIDSSKIDFSKAKLCFSLSDFKGIEEEIVVKYNNQNITLRPGLPMRNFGNTGLSAPVNLTLEMLRDGIDFSSIIKVKGSEEFQFLPLASSSKFQMKSAWPSPSFNGNVLPSEHTTTDSGFVANWAFNRANLPFSVVNKQNEMDSPQQLAFGTQLVQPADQYAKTERSVKYAVLFIGLTFAFFFFIEIFQKNPFHPVQYVLVGVALLVFYTLLLSISEYLPFSSAYLIAALATILLVTLYTKSHFNSWKTAGIFFGLLTVLYTFIFVLINLQDTALIIGSIGLFIILAIAMYASRKINWYGSSPLNPKPEIQ